MPFRNRGLAYLWLLPLTWAAFACQGQNLAHTAQRGSTIAITLGGSQSGSTQSLVVGYGGTAFTDYQRGEMVYRLDGYEGVELLTRATSTLLGHPASSSARDGLGFNPFASGQQHVSIVDIPGNAPLGTHSLYMMRRVGGSLIEVGVHPAEIKILPASIWVDTDSGPEEIEGEQTQFASWLCLWGGCGWNNVTAYIPIDLYVNNAIMTPQGGVSHEADGIRGGAGAASPTSAGFAG